MKKIVTMLLVGLLCFNGTLEVSANDNEMSSDTVMKVHRVSYTIYDANGNITEMGDLPIDEQEISTRDYWGTRTIETGGHMTLHSQDTGFPYFLIAGSQVNMQFGLNRNALIASGIEKTTGETIASIRGYTGGRSHSAAIKKTGDYRGYIRNDDASPVTVNYVSFLTND